VTRRPHGCGWDRWSFAVRGCLPRPCSVPADEERAHVKLLIVNGYARHLVCKCINNVMIRTYRSHRSSAILPAAGNRKGPPRQDCLDAVHGKPSTGRSAICKVYGPEDAAVRKWRPAGRPYEVGSARRPASDVPALQIIVQFAAPKHSIGGLALLKSSPCRLGVGAAAERSHETIAN
jgi:hypothetical protein